MPSAKRAKKSPAAKSAKSSSVKSVSSSSKARAKKTLAASSKNQKAKPDFPAAFAALRGLLESFQPEIVTQTDKPGNYHTEIPGLFHRKRPLYFAGIKTGKNYVSFHLLPVYYNPDLNKRISPELKKRKQGMACFNFTAVDDACFAELRKLTALGLKMFKTAEFRRRLEKLQ